MGDSKKRILISDDNLAILDALKMMLEEEGYEVETTNDGATIQNAQEFLPDLLLLDVWMPGMSGINICKQLKSAAATKRIPIIMVSATKDIEQIAKNSGADDFIAKPFQMENLLAIVAKYVNNN
jgi:DNA-binding response OmpR family regulator